MDQKIKILCKVEGHGYFECTPDDHITLSTGCAKCSGNYRLNRDEFIRRSVIVHGDNYDYSNVIFTGTKYLVEIYCKKHDDIFIQRASGHLAGMTGCVRCSMKFSKKEKAWLDSLGIPDDNKHRHVKLVMSCGKIHNVDGYDPINKIVYEFLGTYWHGDPRVYTGENFYKENPNNGLTYEFLFNRTVEKIRLLRKNGYKVVSIWESVYDCLMKEKKI